MQNIEQNKKGFEWGFNFIIFLLWGIMPLIVTPWRGEQYYDGKIVFTILIVVFSLIVFRKQLDFRKNDFVTWLLIGYVAFAVLSTIYSVDVQMSIWGYPRLREGIFSHISYALIAYIFYRVGSFRMPIGVTITIFVVSVFVVLQNYDIVKPVSDWIGGAWEEGHATIGQRNFLGTYCTLFLTILCGLWVLKGQKASLICSMFLFAALLISVTRGSWIACSVAGIAFLLLSIKRPKSIKRWIIMILIFSLIYIAMDKVEVKMYTERAETIIHDVQNITEDETGSNRIYIWTQSIPLLLQRPLLGSGPDTFGVVFGGEHSKMLYDKAHNEILHMIITMGYPEALIYVVLILLALVRVGRAALIDDDAKIIFIIIIAYVIQAMFNISVIVTAPIFWSVLGLALSYGVNDLQDVKKL